MRFIPSEVRFSCTEINVRWQTTGANTEITSLDSRLTFAKFNNVILSKNNESIRTKTEALNVIVLN